MLIYVSTEVFFLLLSHGTLEDVELPKKRGNLWNERFINIPSQSSLLLFFLPFLTRWLSMCSSYGIPLLLLHVTIEGRPHSSARELRGDGLKITRKMGWRKMLLGRKKTTLFRKNFQKSLFCCVVVVKTKCYTCYNLLLESIERTPEQEKQGKYISSIRNLRKKAFVFFLYFFLCSQ